MNQRADDWTHIQGTAGMAKKRASADDTSLFSPSIRARRRRPLFLPRLLAEEARKELYQGSDQEQAFDVVRQWADLESEGHLRRKERSLDAEFLHEVFGTALGYKTSTDSPTGYHLEREFTVPGVGSADGALGQFRLGQDAFPLAVIELKAADVDLDRDRFNGRTPVQQCWDYMNALPECPWGIVSNFVTIRLYHRDKTPLALEEFSLQDLRELTRFREFYCLFHRHGLVEPMLGRPPRAQALLKLSDERQREVGDELYVQYSENRLSLIYHLHQAQERPLDTAIRIAQKILDRIIFIAFCEDRDLLPPKVIEQAIQNIAPFDRARNPKWRNFLNLFRALDEGHSNLSLREGYNGGLFAHDPDVDDLQLDDDWTDFFQTVSRFDFKDEVNVDVLGHLFEKSITELERMRAAGLFDTLGDSGDPKPTMPKSAERKRFGIYYTPPDFTTFIVRNTVSGIIRERFDSLAQAHGVTAVATGPDAYEDGKHVQYWRACLSALREIKVCDPACGSGAFLIAAYELLEEHYLQVADHLELLGDVDGAERLRNDSPDMILADNLFGVDVSLEAVEITQLALWIRSARRGKTLANLSQNIVCGNSLVSDSEAHPRAMSWEEAFPSIFTRDDPGFDCVIGNPPWERVKLQEREFFALSMPKIAGAVSAATRRKMTANLARKNPELFERYSGAKEASDRMLTYARSSGRYPLTGKGDINYYVLFAELARAIVASGGVVGLLVPSGIASDNTTREFFNTLMESNTLICLYDFENRKGIFADLHRSFKFCTLLFGGANRTTTAADFVFFAHSMEDLEEQNRHIALSATDMALLNPNTKTCPIFRSRRDAEITKAIYRRIPVLVDATRNSRGDAWGVKFVRMFDQTNDAELFHTAEQLAKMRFKRDRNRWKRGRATFLPLYEAKMVQMYDHRAAGVSVDPENWVRQGQTEPTSLVSHQNPEFAVEPRWWVNNDAICSQMKETGRDWFVGFKDITSPTNERTMIASAIPWSGVTNHFVLMLTDTRPGLELALLANLNSFAFDYVTRQKIGGITLNFFIVKQLPTLAPDTYADRCPWDARQTLEKWVSNRVLKLTCTADDMRPLARTAGFKREVNKWKAEERARLLAELDAAYFLLYGIKRGDVEYILSTFGGTRRRDESELGRFRTAGLILGAYDKLWEACQTNKR